ncbi:MAG: bifunctional phosphoribosylaminoimidazolecarboxamide formyltransferase/IMP cyclohydrolase [Nitrospirae bacterium]|nr:bifunctional phosphoribosylaminoimidazolecarboxamide formyltransferase/IMP cyclohydrolase [Nitrospirota bacterium]
MASQSRRALLSVSDKHGILDLARGLSAMGWEIVSTGGTARALAEAGLNVRDVASVTGFPEMLDGRVKTLHPKVHGGLLGIRKNSSHREQMAAQGIEPIDLVAVNLYPFEETIGRPGVTLDEAIENIDIGGPAMLRSAAKNFRDVIVLVDPRDYAGVLAEIQKTGDLPEAARYELARKVFAHTARYDALIASYLERRDEAGSPVQAGEMPSLLTLQFEKIQGLRYGENPHQRAAFYRDMAPSAPSIAAARALQGKELSFNNVLDADSALALVLEFDAPAAAIIKHNNPCGVATGSRLVEAYRKAKATDPVSAFGGVIAFNRKVDQETAAEVTGLFAEVVIAPGFDAPALAIFSKKPALRLLDVGPNLSRPAGGIDLKKVRGGLLVQERDTGRIEDFSSLSVPTRRRPTDEEVAGIAFAWRVAKHVKSNAIVYAVAGQTIGIGAGQMSRVDSARLGIVKAESVGMSVRGSVMASDAFFPFRDGIDAAAQAGVTAIVQPGGSVKDAEVVAAADEHGLAMVFTGMRHFRH